VDGKGNYHYLTLWQALGCSSPDLSLSLEWNDGKQKESHLSAGGILGFVGHLVPVYGPFLKHANSLGRPFYPFAYDWRRDLNETAEKFQNFLREIHTKHNQKIQIIAHSMGGLITLASINTHNGELVKEDGNGSAEVGGAEKTKIIDIVHSVVYAGVPFRTGIGFLKDLTVEIPIGRNKKILHPSVVFSFPSVYTFFPGKENPRLLDKNNNLIPVDFYDSQEWIERKLGIFSEKPPKAAQVEHLKNCMTQARLFRSKIAAVPNVAYPPTVVLASHSFRTVTKFSLNGDIVNFEGAEHEMGDGRIVNATPPDGISYKSFETTQSHQSLLNDLPIIDQILETLRN